MLDIYCRRIVLHTKSSYLWQVGETPINMNTADITEPAVVHELNGHCNRLSKHLLPADLGAKIYHGKVVPKSMSMIDFV